MTIFLITIAAFAFGMAGMGLGVILNGKCIRGTCSGEDVIGPDGRPLLCGTCPKREAGDCPSEQ